MATEEIEISQLELADEILADMVTPVETATETKAITLSQLRKWLGSSLPTGFILPAVGRIEDSRFTLLDGKTLSRTGTYEDFCNKVIEQVNAGNWFSCTQAEYDQDLSNYGQCGRFVIETDYVRIPTITRYVGATITLSEIGKTYEESLPNIKFGFRQRNVDIGATGALVQDFTRRGNGNSVDYASGDYGNSNFNASRSSSTYKDGAKVNPEHTKYPYYMVISTTGQTAEVGIDINNVYEDLNLKANRNLSNLTAEGKSLASGLGMPSNRYITITPPNVGTEGEYIAPANGYMVGSYNVVSTKFFWLLNATAGFLGTHSFSAGAGTQRQRVFCPIKKGQRAVFNIESGSYEYIRFYYAEGN